MKLPPLIVCLAAIGMIGCKKEGPGLTALPGRRMAKADVIALAVDTFSQKVGYSYDATFTNGIWEVVCQTNKAQTDWPVVARIRDADGVILKPNQP